MTPYFLKKDSIKMGQECNSTKTLPLVVLQNKIVMYVQMILASAPTYRLCFFLLSLFLRVVVDCL